MLRRHRKHKRHSSLPHDEIDEAIPEVQPSHADNRRKSSPWHLSVPHPTFRFLHHHHRHSHPQRLSSDAAATILRTGEKPPSLTVNTGLHGDPPDHSTLGNSISPVSVPVPVPWPEPATAPATPEEKRQQKRHVGWTPLLKRQTSDPADMASTTVDPPEPPPRLVAFVDPIFAAEVQDEDPDNYLHRRRCSSSGGSGRSRAHSAYVSSGKDTASVCSSTESNISDQEQDENLLSTLVVPPLRRRSSCPSVENHLDDMTSSPHMPARTNTISIAEAQHRSRPPMQPPSICRRRPKSTAHVETWLDQMNHSKALRSPPPQQEQEKQRHSPVASDTKSRSNSSGSFASTRLSTFSKSSCSSGQDIPPAVDPLTKHSVLDIANILPRSYDLQRRTSRKREKRALRVWQQSVQGALDQVYSEPPAPVVPGEKRQKYALTRRFILREFYTTEVTFWNQLYFSKVVSGVDAVYLLRRPSYPLLSDVPRCLGYRFGAWLHLSTQDRPGYI